MSAGGFIAQALLGGTQGAAQGIGNKIREEAKLKRQQALEETRTENRMQEQAHVSALNIGEQNLKNEHTAEQARLRREHERELAKEEHKRRKGLVDYRLSVEQEAAKENGEYTIDPRVKIQIDEVQERLKHLRKLETNLRSKSTDPFGNAIGGSTEEGGLTYEEINSRYDKNTQQLNILLGNKEPTNADNSLLKMAMDTPAEERPEFMKSLKEDDRATPELVSAIEALYAMENQEKPESQSETPKAKPEPSGQDTAVAPEQQPQGGMISQATDGQGEQPQAQPKQQTEQSSSGQNIDMTPNNNSAQTLQDQIVAKSRKDAEANYKKSAKEAQRSVENLLTYGTFSKMNKSDRAEALRKYGEYLPAMSPEIVDQLKAIFGADEIEKYLN